MLRLSTPKPLEAGVLAPEYYKEIGAQFEGVSALARVYMHDTVQIEVVSHTLPKPEALVPFATIAVEHYIDTKHRDVNDINLQLFKRELVKGETFSNTNNWHFDYMDPDGEILVGSNVDSTEFALIKIPPSVLRCLSHDNLQAVCERSEHWQAVSGTVVQFDSDNPHHSKLATVDGERTLIRAFITGRRKG